MAKLSDLTDLEWFTRLERKRQEQKQAIANWWQYYDGEQPLYFIAKILEEQQDRFPALTINWCELFIDWIDARCQVEGFRLNGLDAADDDLWEIWQRNDLDEDQSPNNVASLVTGVSWGMVGPSEAGALITIESPDSVAVEVDPRTRRVIAGEKAWKSDPLNALEDMVEVWMPASNGGVRVSTFVNGKKEGEATHDWMATGSKLQTSPEVPIVPFFNRKRNGQGRSELRALKPVVDAANQIATNMMAGVEHHAVPRKWGLGLREEDFKDKDGNPLPAWKIATGAVWVNPFDEDHPDAKPEVGQFAASDLRNFHESISLLGRIGAGLCNIAPHEFGFGVADNPASADGIEAAKESGVRRVERTHVARGSSYEKVMRIASAIEGRDPSAMVRLETVWRDPSTPTQQAKVQAAALAYSQGLADLRQAREDAGYSATQIKAMEERESDGDPEIRRAIEEMRAAREQATGVSADAAPSGN